MILIPNQRRKVPGLGEYVSDGPGNASHTETAARLEPRARLTAREDSSSEVRKAAGQTVCFMGKRHPVMGVEMLKENLLVTNPQERKINWI